MERARHHRIGAWSFDAETGVLSRPDGGVGALQPRQCALLRFLAENASRVVPKRQLLEEVWGDVCVEEGVLARAICELRQALGDDARRPRYLHTHPRRGYRLQSCPGSEAATGPRVAALGAYERGLELADRLREPDLRVAIQLLERAVALEPELADAHAALAIQHLTLFRDGAGERTGWRRAQAWLAVARGMALAPERPAVRHALGYYYHAGLNDYGHALEQYRIAEATRPTDERLLTHIAAALRRSGRFTEALRYQERAVALDPTSAVGLWELGNTYQALRFYERAQAAFAAATSLRPDQYQFYASRAHVQLLWRGDVAGARQILAEGIGEGSAWLLALSLDLDSLAGDHASALDRLRAAPELIECQFFIRPREGLRGQILEAQGESELAAPAYAAARHRLTAELLVRPRDPRVHMALGRVLADEGRATEALRRGQRAVELFPVEEDVFAGAFLLLDLARIYARSRDPAAALGILDRLLERPAGLAVSAALLDLDPAFAALRQESRLVNPAPRSEK
jgi:DNA-binding winged helix-turn-helix (wHTH) protein/tetratricopeptide (TPR) repeat protein